jgi:hypothetical protein
MSAFKLRRLEPGCRNNKRCYGRENLARCECGRRALFRSLGKKGNRRLHSDSRHSLCANCYKRLADACTGRLNIFVDRDVAWRRIDRNRCAFCLKSH